MIDVRQLEESEWELYRTIRLAALSDAPYAFGSTYEGELAFTEAKWRERAPSGAAGKESICIIALDGDQGVGIAGGVTPPNNPRVSQLVSMWVHADHRGTDVATRLVAQVEVWAFDRGSERIICGLTQGNERAAKFYEKVGFEPYVGELATGATCYVALHKPLAVS
jgi:GNAT superfamily N-acetyltransferase